MGRSAFDLTGHKYGDLVVEYPTKSDSKGRRHWFCRCACGASCEVPAAELRRSTRPKRDCGCKTSDRLRTKLTHGMSKTRQYKVWCNMLGRCNNPNHPQFRHYGERGIKVCPQWTSFSAFWSDMERDYSVGAYLDRIDVNGRYERSNCRWVTPRISSENRRNAILVELNGELMNLSEAARRLGVCYGALFLRIKRGWPMDRVLDIKGLKS